MAPNVSRCVPATKSSGCRVGLPTGWHVETAIDPIEALKVVANLSVAEPDEFGQRYTRGGAS